ncbi:MAG TPA: ABC transporter permease, partial [Chitinophagaceae bacterium]
MFRNYLKIALRNLRRNKVYSFINIAGLSLGLACAMLIILYGKDEASYDRFQNNVANIYRVVRQGTYDNKTFRDPNSGYLQGPRFSQNVAGIQSFVRVQSWTTNIQLGTEIKSQDVLFVDSNFFHVFTFPLIAGNPATCLKDPHSVVISESVARRQFGTTNAVGKTIMMRQDTVMVPYQVSAVAKKVPQNSSIKFDMLLAMQESAADAANDDNWYNMFLNTFLVLNPKANIQHIEHEIQNYYESNTKDVRKAMIAKYGPGSWDDQYSLQPFLAMHLSTELPAQNGLSDPSNPMYTYILSAIALFILVIACINFVNLTIARSVKRAREIGIRKVVGSERKQLIFQFLGESFLLCFIAFVLAVLVVKLALPVFNELANKSLALSYLLDLKLIAAYLALFLVTGFLAGFYPALVLSGYQPVKVLYGRFQLGGKNYLQRFLVVLQFSIAAFLITGTLI